MRYREREFKREVKQLLERERERERERALKALLNDICCQREKRVQQLSIEDEEC